MLDLSERPPTQTMPSVRGQLEAARHELLDLGLRNPLLNYRTSKARGLDVTDEVPAELLRVLVDQGRPMSFLQVPDPDDAPADLFESGAFEGGEYTGDVASLLRQPEDEGDGPASRHTDTRLQTPYTSDKLQSRLLSTFYAARTFVEEQGVNVLYLALGMLEWVPESSSDKPRRAPLLLVPVELTRTDVRARFRLVHTGEDVGGNLSLQAKLKTDFGLQIPMPDPEAELDVAAYFGSIANVVADVPRWRVDPDAIHLGFFQFGKLLMYNDLDVDVWPDDANPLRHEVLRALLGEGFAPAPGRLSEDDHLDAHLHPEDVRQVVDADSSQTLALLDVQGGHHLVIQGPPGTGKSQTITNVIAEAVGAGKSVLFVAEKMAALEVVKRRLDGVHLGDACLELHSHKTNKKEILAELQRTLALGRPRSTALGTDLEVLVDTRDRLNAYSQAVNGPVAETGVTPHDAYGALLLRSGRWAGVRPPLETDRSMETWTHADHARRRARVADMQALVAKIGRPTEHPFWGSNRRAFLPTERGRVEDATRAAQDATGALARQAGELGASLGLAADTPADAQVLVRAARRALAAPDLRGVRVDASEWHARRADVAALVETGEAYAAVRARYDGALIPEAWDADVFETRQHLAAHGETWYRWFVGDWRRAKAALAGLMQEPLPKDHADRLALVDAVLQSQRLRTELSRFSSLGAGLFGLQWESERSDWPVLRRISAWMAALHSDVESGDIPRGLIAFLSGGPDLDALEPLVAAAEDSFSVFDAELDAAVAEVDFDENRALRDDGLLDECPFPALMERLGRWLANVPRLQEIVTFNHQSDALFDDDLALFVDLAVEWHPAGTHLVDAFDHAWYSTLLDTAFVERAPIARFDGALHDETLRRFADRDRVALEYNQARLALAHWEGMPRHGEGTAAGQLGTLRHEFSKRSRHKPIRRLMTEAGRAIQAVKPVFMMSPMSVAAYLPPGAVEFDLVVFDEASQVKPVDAFGALLRGHQAVVVGDSKQLPPTSFFDSVVGDGDEDEASETRDVESVLELFKARQAPERMLGWHYRSRHESLIAVSNREFYDGKLIVFPSPDAERADVGLVYRHLPDARYDRGGSRANRAEAREVAEAVMAHARRAPELTLLVATFSQAQQKEVRDQLELLRKQDPTLESFFADDALEPFEVKNLENVQGDERDVVFISVGYGRDQTGAVSMNFGPLNRDGGERRLNVLVTRARRRCEVFTNLRADDLDLNRTNARGVTAFKRYLQYAETGVLEMDEPTGRESDSPFEDAVADALRAAGHRVVHQVGVGGFRIDLAVVDPERPGRYLLGIECDGATYHSARTARDRDRIRQTVLEGLGWQIHRVWSTDWFRDPTTQLKRVVAAIEQAKANPAPRNGRPPSTESAVLARDDDDDGPVPEPARAEPYVTARVRGFSSPLHEVPRSDLAEAVVAVVQVESPVHVDEVARRIMDASGVRRLGNRIREAVEAGVTWATRYGGVGRRGDFLFLLSMRPADIVPRDRSGLPNGSRSFDYIAPEEIEATIREVISSSFGITAEALPLEVCRMLGFGQTSGAMRMEIEGTLHDLQSTGEVTERHGQLHLSSIDSKAS